MTENGLNCAKCAETHPVQVEHKGDRQRHRPAGHSAKNSQRQSDEELGPKLQGAAISRD